MDYAAQKELALLGLKIQDLRRELNGLEQDKSAFLLQREVEAA